MRSATLRTSFRGMLAHGTDGGWLRPQTGQGGGRKRLGTWLNGDLGLRTSSSKHCLRSAVLSVESSFCWAAADDNEMVGGRRRSDAEFVRLAAQSENYFLLALLGAAPMDFG